MDNDGDMAGHCGAARLEGRRASSPQRMIQSSTQARDLRCEEPRLSIALAVQGISVLQRMLIVIQRLL